MTALRQFPVSSTAPRPFSSSIRCLPKTIRHLFTKLISNQFQSNNEESATLLQKEATRNLAGENENEDEVQTAKDPNPTKAKASTHMR